MAHTPAALPLAQVGIRLDADSIRAELDEAPEAHGLDAQQAEQIEKLPDDDLNEAINEAADDDFWVQYDAVRSRAIVALKEKAGI